jgi:hypothetical protein
MYSNGFFRRHTAGAFVVALAIPSVLLLSGPANAAPLASTASPICPHSLIDSASIATSTTLTTSPASPVTQGAPATLTATVTPAAAVGTMQFKDGTTNLGPPVTVSKNGTASGSTSRLTVGSHQLTAVFAPRDPAAYSYSTSGSVSLLVTASQGGGAATPPEPKLPDLKLPDLKLPDLKLPDLTPPNGG